MVFEILNYRISPYSGNTCWKIQERGAEDAKSEWREANYFPATFEDALRKTRQLCLLSEDSDAKVKTVDEAIKAAEKINKAFEAELKKIKGKYPDQFED